jgi:3-oxoacyl-[acyl-carrier-protein] synthase III
VKVLLTETLGRGVRLASTGMALPERVVSNDELVSLGVPLSAQEIVKLCGIETRRWVAPEQATSDLAAAAARDALARAGVPPASVERIVLGTVSPDHPSPSAACFVHRALALPPLPVYDVTASCSGFLFALDAAARAVLTGETNVLAIAADVRSKFLDLKDRSTAALFGDGAGAALLQQGPQGEGLVAIATTAAGHGAHHVYVPAGGSREPLTEAALQQRRTYIRMEEGPQVYFAAVEGMLEMAKALLCAVHLGIGDVDLVIPHQPNIRILERLRKLLGLPSEKLWVNVTTLGNMSAASCAVALHEALSSGRYGRGARVLLLTGGAGFTAGAALLVL